MGIFDMSYIKKYATNDEAVGGEHKYDTIIETGTLFGEGTHKMAQHFKKVYTVELSYLLYENACQRFKDNPRVQCMYGDSKAVLQYLLPVLKNTNSSPVFFLDAHWSGDSSVDWKNSKWKGYKINT